LVKSSRAGKPPAKQAGRRGRPLRRRSPKKGRAKVPDSNSPDEPPMEDDDAAPPRSNVQICLSGAKIAYARGQWYDVSDKEELMGRIHPLVAENISLKRRAERLVRLVAEEEFEARQLDDEMMECDAAIRDLKRILRDTGGEEEDRGEGMNDESD
jgi:hypothetical protein